MSNHVFKPEDEARMGLMTSYRWRHDPRTVLFMLARYKWVAKMLEGYGRVMEVGCGDGFGSHLVRGVVDHLACTDIDAAMIDSARASYPDGDWRIGCRVEKCDAIYALDVIEHMPHAESDLWVGYLAEHAPVCIIGSPSLESQPYASQLSRENHVNTMSMPNLKALMKKHFRHIFCFSMNDEVVHTGYHKMAHYLFALGVK